MSWEKLFLLFFCAFYHFSIVTNDQRHFFIEEVRSLSELPIERLIQIKMNLFDNDVEESKNSEDLGRSTALSLPMALPLKRMGTIKSIRRHEDYWEEKGKDSKISKIFQLTVTALSFLAFGGYLLTLILMAIRRNQNSPNAGNVIVFSNLQGLQKYKRPKRRAWLIDPEEHYFDQDRMYRGMIMLSQCYSDLQK